MKLRFLAVVSLVALGFCLGTLDAQKKDKKEDANTRSVQGVVTDQGDRPVEGAVVQLKDTKTLQIRSFITHHDGAYRFHGLSINTDYQLKAEHKGWVSGTRTLSVFDDRRTPIIDLKLEKKEGS